MGLLENKITPEQLAQYGVVSAPDRLTGTAAENKAVFDKLISQIVSVQLNAVLELLSGAAGAGEIGTSPIGGLTGETVQAILTALKALRDSDVSGQGAANQSVQEALANRYTKTQADALLALKCDQTTANTLIKTIQFDGDTGVFTITTQGGGVTTIDTLLEKVPATFSLEGNKLVLTLEDGTRQEADLSAFIDTYTFTDSDTVDFAQTGKNISAQVKDGSITVQKLDPAVQGTLEGFALRAETAEEGAGAAKTAAEAARDAAQSAAGSASASATAAATSRSNAAVSETNAAASKTAAATSATQAEASNVAAAGHEQSALAYKNAAAQEADRAKREADRAAEIVGGDFATRTDVATAKSEAISTAAADAAAKANIAESNAKAASDPIGSAATAKSEAVAAAAADATTKADTAKAEAIAASIPLTQRAQPNGVATLDAVGKVPAAQLPAMDYDPLGSAATAQEVVQVNLDAHAGDTIAHVTADEKSGWDNKAKALKIIQVSLTTDAWTGTSGEADEIGSPWYQSISNPNIKTNTQIDFAPNEEVMIQMAGDGTTVIFAKNENGNAQAVAMGEKPTVNLSVQATLLEVTV